MAQAIREVDSSAQESMINLKSTSTVGYQKTTEAHEEDRSVPLMLVNKQLDVQQIQ